MGIANRKNRCDFGALRRQKGGKEGGAKPHEEKPRGKQIPSPLTSVRFKCPECPSADLLNALHGWRDLEGGARIPKGPNHEKEQSRLKFSISASIPRIDLEFCNFFKIPLLPFFFMCCFPGDFQLSRSEVSKRGWRTEGVGAKKPFKQASFLYPFSYAPLGEWGRISGELFGLF